MIPRVDLEPARGDSNGERPGSRSRDDVLTQLKAAAKAHGRSLQAAIHEILHRASTRSLADTRRLPAEWVKPLQQSTQSEHPNDPRVAQSAVSVYGLDASVVIKWFVPEVYSGAARRLLASTRMTTSPPISSSPRSAMPSGPRSEAAN